MFIYEIQREREREGERERERERCAHAALSGETVPEAGGG